MPGNHVGPSSVFQEICRVDKRSHARHQPIRGCRREKSSILGRYRQLTKH
jgi:hypothetical protein